MDFIRLVMHRVLGRAETLKHCVFLLPAELSEWDHHKGNCKKHRPLGDPCVCFERSILLIRDLLHSLMWLRCKSIWRLFVQLTGRKYTTLFRTEDVNTACYTILSDTSLMNEKTRHFYCIILLTPSLKISSPCHVASDGYTAPILNLNRRLRGLPYVFSLSLLQPPGFLPTAGLKARDVQCAGDCNRQPPLVLWFLCTHSPWKMIL